MTTRDAEGDNPAINAPTGETFSITDGELYIPVVTLSAEDDNKLLQQLKRGFKTTIKWNKYRWEMIIQAKTNNLNYLIDPTFSNYLCYHLKMKMIEQRLVNIIQPLLK